MGKLINKIRDHYFRDIINRINDLETGIRVLINSPSYVHSEEIGFNGQVGRKQIFKDLLREFRFFQIIETGTYLGDTTGYMAKTAGIPVFSCEKNNRLHDLSKMRLKDISSVYLFNKDSREFLLKLSENYQITKNECFIYLDAHWGKDLPLREEISIVASRWERFIIMIDDFEVPGDKGYIHDSYGTLEYINMKGLRSQYDLCLFFPSTPSTEEPNPPVGCVVLAKRNEMSDRLKKLKSLKIYEKSP